MKRRLSRSAKRKSLWTVVLGLIFALFLHIAFLEMILFKFARPAPAQPVVAADAPTVSLYSLRAQSPADAAPSADDLPPKPLRPKAALPDPPQVAPPNPTVQALKLVPRPVDFAGPVLPAMQTLSTAPDLQGEPMPLHGDPRPTPQAGAPPPPAAGPTCRIAQMIQQKIQQDDQLRGWVARLPRQSRSVADAILLWNGTWVTIPQADGQAPLAAIQTALRDVVQGSPLACHQQPVLGPEFITIVGPASTTVLVVGSGRWTWGDLLR